MNKDLKEFATLMKYECFHLIENARQKESFDMLVWAFNLGQHQKTLKEIENLISRYIDKGTELLEGGSIVFQVDEKDLISIFHQIQFIVQNMVP